MTATFIKDLGSSAGGAHQKLYKLDPPLPIPADEYPENSAAYIVVSAAYAMFSGPETYIFASDENGNITSFSELEGSYRGGLDHQQAIDNLLESEMEAQK